jgi:acetyl esterase/lipase
MTESPEPDSGTVRLRELIAMLPMVDPRDDIDTASLVRRFPYLGDVVIDDITIDGPHGPIFARRYVGPKHTGEAFVWVHGGAFIAGGLDMPESHWVSMEFASRGIPVLALDYRKALDGVHHPVLSDEVLAGWDAAPELLGTPVEHLHLGGASAGANLSAGVAARLRDSSAASPSSLVLVYPVLHPELPEASPEAAAAADAIPPEARFAPDFTRAINVNYVGGTEQLGDPIAFAGSGDVAGFPATLILNAEGDDLRPSGELFGAQLEAAGVSVTTEYEPGTLHGYLDLPGETAAINSIDRITTWLSGAR